MIKKQNKVFIVCVISLICLILFSVPVFAEMTYSQFSKSMEPFIERVNKKTATIDEMDEAIAKSFDFLYGSENGSIVYSGWKLWNYDQNYFNDETVKKIENSSLTEEEKTQVKQFITGIYIIEKAKLEEIKKLDNPTKAEDYLAIYQGDKSRIDKFNCEELENIITMLNAAINTFPESQKSSLTSAKNYYQQKLDERIPSCYEDFMWIYVNAKSRISSFEKELLEKGISDISARQSSNQLGKYTSGKVNEAKEYYTNQKIAKEYMDTGLLDTLLLTTTGLDMDISVDNSASEIRARMKNIKDVKKVLSNPAEYNAQEYVEKLKNQEDLFKIILVNDVHFKGLDLCKGFTKSELQECLKYLTEANPLFVQKMYESEGTFTATSKMGDAQSHKTNAINIINNFIDELDKKEEKEKEEAAEQAEREKGNFTNFAQDFKNDGMNLSGANSLVAIVGRVLRIIRNIGAIVSVVCISVIGIKYMLGSVEQKAEYKKSLVPFVFGLIMFTGIVAIITFIINVTNNTLS